MPFVKILRFTGKQYFDYSNFCNVKIALIGFFFLFSILSLGLKKKKTTHVLQYL